jgi:hypothetical protein
MPNTISIISLCIILQFILPRITKEPLFSTTKTTENEHSALNT